MDNIRKVKIEELQINRFKTIISILEKDYECKKRAFQGELLGITENEVSSLLCGSRKMSETLANTISDNLRNNHIMNVSPQYLLCLSDFTGKNVSTGIIKPYFNIDLLKYINDRFGNINLISEYENIHDEILLFTDNVTIEELNLNDNTAILIYTKGKEKKVIERINFFVTSVKIERNIYSFFEFRTFYKTLEKQISNCFDTYNFILSENKNEEITG